MNIPCNTFNFKFSKLYHNQDNSEFGMEYRDNISLDGALKLSLCLY